LLGMLKPFARSYSIARSTVRYRPLVRTLSPARTQSCTRPYRSLSLLFLCSFGGPHKDRHIRRKVADHHIRPSHGRFWKDVAGVGYEEERWEFFIGVGTLGGGEAGVADARRLLEVSVFYF